MRRLTMRWLLALSACLAVACAPARPPAPRPIDTVQAPPAASSTEAAVVSAPLSQEAALAEAERRFVEADVDSVYDVDNATARLGDQGLDEERTTELLEAMARTCLSRQAKCEGLGVLDRDGPKQVREALRMLLAHLERIGHIGSVPLLTRLHARGVYGADTAIEAILGRQAREKARPCTPPSPPELDEQRAHLGDFAVLEHDGTRWIGRSPSAEELEDLVYFFAAVRHAGAAVGTALEKTPSPLGARAEPDAKRVTLVELMESALMRGDVRAHADAARAYLVSLGYPGPLRSSQEGSIKWGGPGYAYVMRDLSRSLEILGEFEEAAALARRAAPGGGACGTSTAFRRSLQTRALVRTVELTRGCREVVPERLFADGGYRSEWYGPERLAEAGFDLARLYRGALLTLGRDIPEPDLRNALATAPGRLGRVALDRLTREGSEAWEPRTRALEGYADTMGKEAFPLLLALAARGSAPARARAILALGRLLEVEGSDPCREWGVAWGRSSSTSGRRVIRSLRAKCETMPSQPDMDAVRRSISGWARDKDPAVREAVAQSLGWIASPASQSLLTSMLKDPYAVEGSTVCTTRDGKETCGPNQPVRQAARAALELIDTVLTRERELEARDKKEDGS